MIKLDMKFLEKVFNSAKDSGERYVAIVVKMDEFSDVEVIINPIENADAKLKYCQKTYDENLSHKHSEGISIIGITYGNSYEEIERNLSMEVEVNYEN